MKRIWIAAVVLFLCLPTTLFGQGLLSGGYPSLSSLTENVKVNPYVQVDFSGWALTSTFQCRTSFFQVSC